MKSRIAFAVMLLLSGGASADFVVNEKVLQNGYFFQNDAGECKQKKGKPVPSDCLCSGKVAYPEVSGMEDLQAQEKINHFFAREYQGIGCVGTPYDWKSKTENQFPGSFEDKSFVVTHQSSGVLSILAKYGHQAKDEDLRHPLIKVEGYIFNVRDGVKVTPKNIFGKNIQSVNKFILSKILDKQGMFVGDPAIVKDNECTDCALVVVAGGIKVVFNSISYAGSMADGNVEFIIPQKFITSPDILQALGGS